MADFSFDLTGRVALVTGASSGLGYRFAGLLAASGARVVAGARRTELLDRLKTEVEGRGGALHPVALDVADEASVIAAYDAAEAAFGPVDTVVANAGISAGGSALGLDMDDFDKVVAVNLRGTFLTAREGARRMVAAGSPERGDGRVVIISSITAHQAAAEVAPYSATKAASAQLGRSLAKAWARKGINVNVLCPGYIATDLNEAMWDLPMGQRLLAGFARGRVMSADALDPLLLLLCSDASAQMTGSVVTADDGQTL